VSAAVILGAQYCEIVTKHLYADNIGSNIKLALGLKGLGNRE
jgi:hypothetical protein